MEAMIRSGGLRGFVPLVRSLGGEPDDYLRRHGLPRDAAYADDVLVPMAPVLRMQQEAALELACPDFGLRMADYQDVSALGPLAVALQASETIGDVLECATRFHYVHSPALNIMVEPDPLGQTGVVALVYRIELELPFPFGQAYDTGMGFIHRTAALLTGGNYGLLSVHLGHPAFVDASRYQDFFEAEVHFDQEAYYLRVPADFLHRRNDRGDPMLRELALDYLERNFPAPAEGVASRVRAAIEQSLGFAPVRIESVARLLLVHPRTLQRQLAAEQTSFEQLLDEVRSAQAKRLITTTELPLSQIAGMVGLSEQSALSRAVRRWFGCPPRALRRAG